MTIRSASNSIRGIPTLEGAGFLVHRPFPTAALSEFDPFLLFDEMGPMDVGPGEAKGAPDHPHRGFETVTYMLSGSFRHKDSQGHEGKLETGDVQWMTAGRGVIHAEEPSTEFQRTGGRLHGVQLWVNLPKTDKMIRPHYQEIPAEKIPSATTPDGKVRVRVIAGESLGAHAVIETRTPIFYLDFTLQPGGEVVQPVSQEFNAFAYVIEGLVIFGNDTRQVQRGNMIPFEKDGDGIRIVAPPENQSSARVLLVGGRPLNEPIARYGPFVMNTPGEIRQAFEDYQSGRMGSINF
jgi:redox-sensitive bicupin YhaK (pirin superfamily)